MGTSRDMTRETDKETEFYDSLLEDKLFDDVDFEAMDEQINQYISTQGPQPSIFSNMMSTEQPSIDRHQEDQVRIDGKNTTYLISFLKVSSYH
jgi:hypothetical protein